ncbi:hypothetical protein BD289DRAFT_479158 [Coniella lustricola]|uniref:AAA+ ATPase domain-containing protein n=1 Tax=Coniella lustricola TaxID=2025994 RepID=A0A2T3AK31_9PEZI|nr:hypothetical protein BD289DRAFT_479158 [Coniella lustricola]
MGPSKRKRDILEGFDPNQSDPEDENFDPTETRSRPSQKTPRSSRTRAVRPGRKFNRYRGSDIDDDDDEVLSDSMDGGSFVDDDDDDEVPVNAAGRRARKAAVKSVNYAEPENSEDDELIVDSEEDAPKQKRKRQKIVVLKTQPRAAAASSAPTSSAHVSTRRTRARTEDADEEEFVELTTSGKHQQAARVGSRSKSPETTHRHTRNSRSSKGLKQPTTSTIEEASHETSFQPEGGNPEDNEVDADAEAEAHADEDEVIQDSGAEGLDRQDVGDEDQEPVEGDVQMDDANEPAEPQKDIVDDDEDDNPIAGRRMTRSFRQSISGPAPKEGDEEPVASRPRRTGRLIRKGSDRGGKHGDDEVSDFNPNESDENEGSEGGHAGDEEGDSSERPARGRRATTRGTNRHNDDDSADELDFDVDELAVEAEDLKRSSRSRSRRTRKRRRESTPITYEERSTRRRPVVDYRIRIPADQIEQEDDEEIPPPASQRRRNAGGAAKWQRTLNSTFGPFGGAGGAGALLAGPWGTGATTAIGGADSDSSDDELGARSGVVGGAVGMTPTVANAPGLHGGGGDLEKLGLGASPNVGRIKDRKALADADPLGVDLNVDFSKVGGLSNHINQLKEMVQLPLLYPELFLRFKLTPPRGVLFHGPPGTGKTLLARALANSIGSGGRKITFYMRKGADALSKWVGEAEKQLRLLFEEARKTQPSIIFFDEIDGLAPVRSSKQEQIHASIVSTLLALMDGMDGRGQVIVIGATNRPDNIDPALRRPGRFDREFYFPLPDIDGRQSILDIHTKDWGLSEEFKRGLAENTKGYGGADLRALCTEAALNAIQRTYPQIYSSEQKLIVDPTKINIHATDFMISIKKIVPSSQRSASSGAAPLPRSIALLLQDQFTAIQETLKNILPMKPKITALEEAMFEPYDDADHGFGRENLQQDFDKSRIFRPRLLITGAPGMGQTYIAAAVLHYFERVHVQNFDLANILGDGRPAEQVIVSMFIEVKRHKPSVIYIPNVDDWCATLGAPAVTTLMTMLKSVPPTDPILLLGTSECPLDKLDKDIVGSLFGFSKKNRAQILPPGAHKRRIYFKNVAAHIRKSPTDFPDPHTRKKRVLEELPIAPPPPPKPKSKEEIKQELKRDRTMLNQLKLRLQPVMDQIKRRYRAFHKPVIPHERYDYLFDEADPNFVSADVPQERPFIISKDKEGTQVLYEVATGKYYYNLDTTVIEERISNGFYARPKDFYKDIRSLVHDIRNTGDRDRIIKANEMESNVDVDMNDIEIATGTVQWEALHQRQLQRHAEDNDKAKKRAAMEAAVGLIQTDVVMNGAAEASQNGAVMIGAPVPRDGGRTLARFRVMSPPRAYDPAHESSLTNGDSAPSRATQSATDQATQSQSQMRPPEIPRSVGSQSQATSAQATAGTTQGGTQQISQISALTSLPPGVSPSAVFNDASTTNDPSTPRKSSSNWSANATNGYHTDGENMSQMPDTQPPGSQPSGNSQLTASSQVPWMHSQADALAHGGLSHVGGNHSTSPTSSQMANDRRASRMGLTNLLNDSETSGESSIRHSGGSTTTSSSQLPVVHDGEINEFLEALMERTSGCSIEQLEQINRELMDHIWASKHEWNRIKVLNQLRQVFNETISDIEEIQGCAPLSQELSKEETVLYGSSFEESSSMR